MTRNNNLGYKSDIINVKRIDILDIFQSFDIPEYLKIDVEGADKLVLEALRKIEIRPRYISMESENVTSIFWKKNLIYLLLLAILNSKYYNKKISQEV